MPLIDGVNYVDIKEHAGVMKTLVDAFDFCKKTDVLVGIPQENNATREDGGVTNVQLMYIHTYGSPARRIPARPTIEPAITDPANRAVLQDLLKVDGVCFRREPTGAMTNKKRAGMMAVNMIKTRFGSAALAPNAPSTIRRKGIKRSL